MIPSYKPTTEAGTEKIAKYLARCGVGSRRQCEEYVRAGCVQIDRVVVTTPETRIHPDRVQVAFKNRILVPPKTYRYLLFNKPVGVVSTCRPDREKGSSLRDWVKVPERVFPAGRLDRDTTGLLILTNDGELMQKLIHPSFQQEREYLVTTQQPIRGTDYTNLRAGVALDDGFSRFLRVERVNPTTVRIILTEGRKRQIRRTFKALQLPIASLHRVRFGTLRLGQLPVGAWRDLQPIEIERLKA